MHSENPINCPPNVIRCSTCNASSFDGHLLSAISRKSMFPGTWVACGTAHMLTKAFVSARHITKQLACCCSLSLSRMGGRHATRFLFCPAFGAGGRCHRGHMMERRRGEPGGRHRLDSHVNRRRIRRRSQWERRSMLSQGRRLAGKQGLLLAAAALVFALPEATQSNGRRHLNTSHASLLWGILNRSAGWKFKALGVTLPRAPLSLSLSARKAVAFRCQGAVSYDFRVADSRLIPDGSTMMK